MTHHRTPTRTGQANPVVHGPQQLDRARIRSERDAAEGDIDSLEIFGTRTSDGAVRRAQPIRLATRPQHDLRPRVPHPPPPIETKYSPLLPSANLHTCRNVSPVADLIRCINDVSRALRELLRNAVGCCIRVPFIVCSLRHSNECSLSTH